MWYGRNVMYSVCRAYTLLKVIKSHCDLSVLAASLMGFHNLDRDLSSIQILFGFFEFF